jgi:hypothetical protein
VSRLKPLWTASRLNEAFGVAGNFVVFTPDGEIDISRGESDPLPERRGQGFALISTMVPLAEFVRGLLRLPPLLALLSIDPEPWCCIRTTTGSVNSVGPFLDYPSPLWEWLVRAARTDRVRILQLPFAWHAKDPPFDERRIPLPQLEHEHRPAVPTWLRTTLDDFDLSRIDPNATSADDVVAVSAGLMEMHDFAAQSHELAQSVEGRGQHRAGDYWHAIHHRREPDPSNAKYWFRKVGSHPIHRTLAGAVDTLIPVFNRDPVMDQALKTLTGKGDWDPFAFVDFCQRVTESQDANLAWIARKLQFLEMLLLLASTYEDATTLGPQAG